MTEISSEEISTKLKSLMDELAAFKVHMVILASFTNNDGSIVFGVEMNTSQKIAASLLKAGSLRLQDCAPVDERA